MIKEVNVSIKKKKLSSAIVKALGVTMIATSSLYYTPMVEAGFFSSMKKSIEVMTAPIKKGVEIMAKGAEGVSKGLEEASAGVKKGLETASTGDILGGAKDVVDGIKGGIKKTIEVPMEAILKEVGKGALSFMDLAVLMGVDTYIKVADVLPGDVGDQLLGKFFGIVLKNDALTDEMLRYAFRNKAIITLLIRTVDKNPELLDEMENNLVRDVKFGQLFTALAIQDADLAAFFFDKITNGLYGALTKAMVMSRETTDNVGALMEVYGAAELSPGRPFYDIFFNVGAPDNDDDGNEKANERLFYTLMGGIASSQSFLNALATMPQHMQTQLMQFAFAGAAYDENNQRVIHKNQAFYDNYAIIKGVGEGLLPLLEGDKVDDYGDTSVANFERFLPMLFTYDENGKITGGAPYAFHFFVALRSAAEIHNDPHAVAIMDLLKGSVAYFLIPKADPTAPEPRDFM